MKKIIVAVAVLFAGVVPTYAEAAPESVVIIDSYFDTSAISGSVQIVCLASDKCINKAAPSGLPSSEANHGTSMAKVARKQNATANLILIQTENVSKTGAITTGVDAADFITALTWVTQNSANVSAVSLSRYFNHPTKPCKPSAISTMAVDKADALIQSLILGLSAKNIPVFVSSGNHNKALDYPSCIASAVSVGAVGGVNGSFHATNADVIVSTSSYRFSLTENVVQTTSSSTAAIAALSRSVDITKTKLVNILP